MARGLATRLVLAISMVACGGGGAGPVFDGMDVAQDLGGEANVLLDTFDRGGTEGVAQEVGPEVAPFCKDGEPCDDKDPCTYGERCLSGACVGGIRYACDDGRDCTTDTCDGQGNCGYEVKEGTCLIAGICRQAGEADPQNPCAACEPALSVDAWQPAREDEACEPSLDACTLAPQGGVCRSGTCEPVTTSSRLCADENPCTDDVCDPVKGCMYLPLSGETCFIASACEPGTCREGVCVVPFGASCDDGNPCTVDQCEPEEGCSYILLDGISCEDGSLCTLEDRCVAGQCVGEPLNCNDGNICTQDGCHPVTGCWHDLADNACCQGGVSVCDDGNPCTDDGCDPLTLECMVTFNEAFCDDKDPCTVMDTCFMGECRGRPKACDDGNPCTLDSCIAGQCFHAALDQVPCDDGLECSTGDHCVAGRCVADTSQCVCTPTFSPTVSKVTKLTIASSGHPGQGLDLDQNVATCAPTTDCSGGIDNSLGPIASVGNPEIQKGLDKGSILVLFEHRGFRTDGKPYTLTVYAGRKLDPSNPDCNVQTQVCKYLVDEASFDSDCNPLVALDNAKIVGGRLTAGGKGYVFPFELPLFGDVTLTITLYFARIEADVVVSGNQVTFIKGILGGAVPKQQLKDAINALPPDVELPMPKEQIIMLLDVLVQTDIDGDGDGKKESASIGIQFEGIAGLITGVN